MTRYIRKQNCEAIALDEEWVVINPDHYTVTKLNEVGGFCWSELHTAQSVTTLVDALRDSYGVFHPSLPADIQSFLSNLLGCGIVEYAD